MNHIASQVESLARRVDRHAPEDGEHPTAIATLRFFRRSCRSELTATMYNPSICLVLRGSKVATLDGEALRYDSSHYLIVSADLSMQSQITGASARAPYLCARLELDMNVASDLLASARRSIEDPPARAAAVCAIDQPLLDAVARLIALLDAPEDIPTLAPLTQREITYRLLTGPAGPRLRQLVARGGQAQRIGEALRWLKQHYAEPLRIEVLARRVGMSASSFHHHFKTVMGMSPLQFQKHLRLHEARRLLVAERLDAGEACFRVGYESASQFSREYRRLFGAPPRKDVSSLLAAQSDAARRGASVLAER